MTSATLIDASKVKGKYAVAPLPHGPGGVSSATVGGWQIGVNKFSKHQGAAEAWARYYASKPVDIWRAVNGGIVPTIAVILFVAAYPLGRTFYDSFTDASFGSSVTHFVGWTNYYNLIHDTPFRSAIELTFKFAIITVVFEFVLGIVIAMVVNAN